MAYIKQRWYVVHTKNAFENIAALNLREQNFKVFFPRYELEVTSRKGNVNKRFLPLFPNYLFVKFSPQQHRWQSIHSTRGVISLMGCNETYLSPVPEGCIEEIMSRANKKEIVQLKQAIEQILEFAPEMPLLISGTAYDGAVGSYCNHSENRVTLLLTLLQKPVRVIVPLSAVRPALVASE